MFTQGHMMCDRVSHTLSERAGNFHFFTRTGQSVRTPKGGGVAGCWPGPSWFLPSKKNPDGWKFATHHFGFSNFRKFLEVPPPTMIGGPKGGSYRVSGWTRASVQKKKRYKNQIQLGSCIFSSVMDPGGRGGGDKDKSVHQTPFPKIFSLQPRQDAKTLSPLNPSRGGVSPASRCWLEKRLSPPASGIPWMAYLLDPGRRKAVGRASWWIFFGKAQAGELKPGWFGFQIRAVIPLPVKGGWGMPRPPPKPKLFGQKSAKRFQHKAGRKS